MERIKEALELIVVFALSLLATAGSCAKTHVGGSCGHVSVEAKAR